MALKMIKPYEFKSVQQSILKILKNPRIVNQVIQNAIRHTLDWTKEIDLNILEIIEIIFCLWIKPKKEILII